MGVMGLSLVENSAYPSLSESGHTLPAVMVDSSK